MFTISGCVALRSICFIHFLVSGLLASSCSFEVLPVSAAVNASSRSHSLWLPSSSCHCVRSNFSLPDRLTWIHNSRLVARASLPVTVHLASCFLCATTLWLFLETIYPVPLVLDLLFIFLSIRPTLARVHCPLWFRFLRRDRLHIAVGVRIVTILTLRPRGQVTY